MRKRDFIALTANQLAPKYECLGFTYRKADDSFQREDQEVLKLVFVHAIKWRSTDSILLNLPLHLRVHAVEEILNDFRPYVQQKQRGATTTISRFFGDMLPPGLQAKLIATDESGIRPVCDSGFDAFVQHGFPYLEKFSSVDSMLTAFIGEPVGWPTQDRLRRYEFLLAVYFLRREKQEFESVAIESCDFALTYNSGFHLSYVQSLATGLLSRFENG